MPRTSAARGPVGAVVLLLALAACEPARTHRGESGSRLERATADTTPKPYAPALAAAIAATRRLEAPGRPCLADVRSWPAITDEQRPRLLEIHAASRAFNRTIREKYADRLAFNGLDLHDGRYRHVIALAGTDPIAPLKLRGRAADVPVVVTYNAPWTLREVHERLRQVHAQGTLQRLVPDAQAGAAYQESPDGGWMLITVHSPDGQPRPDVLAHCDALRRAYQLPVLFSFTSTRLYMAPAEARPKTDAPE
ncbi:MAG TPA: hypothetical protein VF632_10140 [Longimicrobium sp.]